MSWSDYVGNDVFHRQGIFSIAFSFTSNDRTFDNRLCFIMVYKKAENRKNNYFRSSLPSFIFQLRFRLEQAFKTT